MILDLILVAFLARFRDRPMQVGRRFSLRQLSLLCDRSFSWKPFCGESGSLLKRLLADLSELVEGYPTAFEEEEEQYDLFFAHRYVPLAGIGYCLCFT